MPWSSLLQVWSKGQNSSITPGGCQAPPHLNESRSHFHKIPR